MAGGLPCSNRDENEAVFMLSNLAGTEHQWVCGYCLGMLGLATLVQLGAVTQGAVEALMNTEALAMAEQAGQLAAAPRRRARKSAAGKDTGAPGESTPPEAHECAGKFEGCDGAGVHQGPAEDGTAEWLCNPCYARVGGIASSLGAL